MLRRPLTVSVAALLLATAACSDTAPADPASTAAPAAAHGSEDAPVAGLPDLPEAYVRTLERAFRTAAEGRDPTMACTSVIARAAGNPAPGGTPTAEAVRAFELCYIDVRARYIEHVVSAIAPGASADARDTTCLKIVSHVIIARSSLGTFAKNVALDSAALDRRLADRVRGSVQPVCPDQFATLEGEG
jgi:hypothetical protein